MQPLNRAIAVRSGSFRVQAEQVRRSGAACDPRNVRPPIVL